MKNYPLSLAVQVFYISNFCGSTWGLHSLNHGLMMNGPRCMAPKSSVCQGIQHPLLNNWMLTAHICFEALYSCLFADPPIYAACLQCTIRCPFLAWIHNDLIHHIKIHSYTGLEDAIDRLDKRFTCSLCHRSYNNRISLFNCKHEVKNKKHKWFCFQNFLCILHHI